MWDQMPWYAASTSRTDSSSLTGDAQDLLGDLVGLGVDHLGATLQDHLACVLARLKPIAILGCRLPVRRAYQDQRRADVNGLLAEPVLEPGEYVQMLDVVGEVPHSLRKVFLRHGRTRRWAVEDDYACDVGRVLRRVERHHHAAE